MPTLSGSSPPLNSFSPTPFLFTPTYPPTVAPTVARLQEGYIAAGVLGGLAAIAFISVWCYLGRATVKAIVTPVI
jgi:hypothetical protein